ncbi:MAG: DUF1566 domain-containing protein [Alphaproteobacteria bacterium]
MKSIRTDLLRRAMVAALAFAFLPGARVDAAPTSEQACESAVTAAAGRYAQCTLVAQSKDAKMPDAARLAAALAKCAEKLDVSIARAVARYGSSSCSSASGAEMSAYLDACVAPVAAAVGPGANVPLCGDGEVNAIAEQCDGVDLDGESCAALGFSGGALACSGACRFDTSACTTTSGCGNGSIETPEQCDGAAFGGASCASLGFASGALACTAGCGFDTSTCVAFTSNQRFPATGQLTCWDSAGSKIACSDPSAAGQDGLVRAGATMSFHDGGDGTITDLNTGLQWEKLDDSGGLHDVTTKYGWTDAFAVKIAALNAGSGFAGHTDWRLPNRTELMSIVSFREVDPYECLDLPVEPAFSTACTPGCSACSCTVASCFDDGRYWTSTSHYYGPGSFSEAEAWFVDFLDGGYANYDGKTALHVVRAVRGGS